MATDVLLARKGLIPSWVPEGDSIEDYLGPMRGPMPEFFVPNPGPIPADPEPLPKTRS